MQRVRRVAPIVALVLLGGVVLSGCRSQPDVAAYVGSNKITEAQVTKIVDDFRERTTPPAQAGTTATPTGQNLPRSSVVTALVVRSVCAKLREERDFATKPTTAQQLVEGTSISPDTEYVKVLADMLTCVSGLEVPGGTPSEEQLRDLYDNAAANNLVDPVTQPFDAVKASLASDPGIQQKAAVQRALAEGAKVTDVVINPRYRPLQYAVNLQEGVFFTVPLGEPGMDVVTPAPATADTAGGAQAPPQ